MELSKTIGSMAVVLAVVLAGGYAVGEDNIAAPTPKTTAQNTVDAREAQRRVSVEEQQKRREHFERVCGRPQKTDMDREACRAAYRAL